MPAIPADFSAAFAKRVAERDLPRPLSQEPAAVRARLEQWLLEKHGVRNRRNRARLLDALLALMQAPELDTATLAQAAGLAPKAARSAARLGVRLHRRGFTTWEYRGIYRYHRLTRATEDALVLVVQGPPVPDGPL